LAVYVMTVCNLGPTGRELDVSALFEKYTVDEIRDIEKKTRSVLQNLHCCLLSCCCHFSWSSCYHLATVAMERDSS